MPEWLIKILGINWRTTLPAITALGAIVAAMVAALKTKDFQSVFDNLPTFFTSLGVVLVALGLMKAKDAKVTGTGTQAKTVHSDGEIVNIDGQKVGEQSPIPPQPSRLNI